MHTSVTVDWQPLIMAVSGVIVVLTPILSVFIMRRLGITQDAVTQVKTQMTNVQQQVDSVEKAVNGSHTTLINELTAQRVKTEALQQNLVDAAKATAPQPVIIVPPVIPPIAHSPESTQ